MENNNSLQVFNYGENTMRTIIKDNEPWFVGKDVAKALGHSNPRRAVRDYVSEKDKTTLSNLSEDSFRPRANGVHGDTQIFINEAGLYSLIFSSKLEVAEKFKDWVTHEVLPSIRKHGMYMTDETAGILRNDPETFNNLLQNYLAEKMKVKALEEKIKADATYTAIGRIVKALPGSISVADASSFLRQQGIKIGRNGLYKYGRENKLLSSQKNQWNKPTQKGIKEGIVNLEFDDTNEKVKFSTRTMITAEGFGKLCGSSPKGPDCNCQR